MFKIIKTSNKSSARLSVLTTPHGEIRGPFFMPIATRGAVKNLTTEELQNLGAEIILSNAYHLMLKPGSKLLKKAGGLHQFMKWPGPILTDSGGFQVFSLAAHREITEKGVKFQDPQTGDKYFLTPEKAIKIQQIIDADVMMCLDVCPSYPAKKIEVAQAVQLTAAWAKRCKFTAPLGASAGKPDNPPKGGKKPLLFGIIQGGIHQDLRQLSAKQIAKIGFDGYAIGGVAVGEPRKYLTRVLKWVTPLIPENKPRYLMGVGRPEEIVLAVRQGIDMFDCVIPSREARHGRLYAFRESVANKLANPSRIFSPRLFYKTININNAKFKTDLKPIERNCGCYTCKNYSRAYLHHLFHTQEPLAMRLATIHNLAFYLQLMKNIRQGIKNGKL